jgi:hypothetical protein
LLVFEVLAIWSVVGLTDASPPGVAFEMVADSGRSKSFAIVHLMEYVALVELDMHDTTPVTLLS